MEDTYRFTFEDARNQVITLEAECKNMYEAFLTAKAIEKKRKYSHKKKWRVIGIVNETQLIKPIKKEGVNNE